MRTVVAALAMTLLGAGSAHAQSVEELRKKYLADSGTSDEIKAAIRKGVVVKGMCPFHAFAAAGLPGPYMVKRDESKWKSSDPPPIIISAQCEAPDKSLIELKFRNASQFGGSDPMVFRVRFLNGRVTAIDTKNFNDE